jgi:hypothetical protein
MSNYTETKKTIQAFAQQGIKPEDAYRRVMKGSIKEDHAMIMKCLIGSYGAEKIAKVLAGMALFEPLIVAIPLLKEKDVQMDDVLGCISKNLIVPGAVINALLEAGATPSVLIERAEDLTIAALFDKFVTKGLKPNEVLAHIKGLDYFRGGEFIKKMKDCGADINILAKNLRLHEYLYWIGHFNKAGADEMVLVEKIRAEETLDGAYAPYCKVFHDDMVRVINKLELEEDRKALILKVESAKPYDFSDVGSAEEWESNQ